MGKRLARETALRRLPGIALLALCAAALAACVAPVPRERPFLILVSLDGFRHDLRALTATPALDAIAAGGVRAARLRPVFRP